MSKNPLHRHLERARTAFGPDAVVTKRSAGRHSKGSLKGKCSVCLKPDCRRKWEMTVGVVVGNLVLLVKGRGHTWKDAWDRAEKEMARK